MRSTHFSDVSSHIEKSQSECLLFVFTFVFRDFLHQLIFLSLLPLQVVFDHGLPYDGWSLVLTRHLDQGTNIKALYSCHSQAHKDKV